MLLLKSYKSLTASFLFLLALAFSCGACKRSTPSDNSATADSRVEIKKKWELKLTSRGDGALALSDDGTIVAACQDGFVHAVDDKGALQWKLYIGATHASPAIAADGAIYIANDSGAVFAINRSGTERWKSIVYEGGTYGHNAGAIGGAFLFTPSRNGLVAVSLSDGKVEWETYLGTEQWGAVTLLADGTVLFGGRGRLNAVSTHGDDLWKYPPYSEEAKRLGGYPPPGPFPVVSGITPGPNRVLYMGVGRDELAAVGQDGGLRWKLDTRGNNLNTASPVVAADSTVYFAHSDGHLYAFDSLGIRKWDLDTMGQIAATPILASDGTIFLMANHFLYAVSPAGKVLAQADLGSTITSSPTIAPDGTVYVLNEWGVLAAYTGGHGGLMDSPWPKFQGDLANTGAEHH